MGTIDANQLVTNWNRIKFASTTTTLTPSSTTFTHGSVITVSGSVTAVSGTPMGEVPLMTDSPTPLQQGLTTLNLTNGAFSSSLVDLPGGTYHIWGRYSGDSKNAPSVSAKTQITVSPEGSILSYSMTPYPYPYSDWPMNELLYGVQMLATAQIAGISCTMTLQGCPNPTIPTGTVVFSDNGVPVSTVPVNAAGVAQYLAPFPVGSHSVTASYSGDPSYTPSTASAVNFTTVTNNFYSILASIDGLSVQEGSNNYPLCDYGQPTVLIIQVVNQISYSKTAAAPTGWVTLSGAPFSVPISATLSPAVFTGSLMDQEGYMMDYQAAEGVATVVIPANTPVGTYWVLVEFVPTDFNYGSENMVANFFIDAADPGKPSSLKVTASAPSPPPLRRNHCLRHGDRQGRHPPPTGSVSFYSSGNTLETITLYPPNSGSTTPFSFQMNSQSMPQGTNLITAHYSGDSNYLPSTATLNLSNPLSDFSMIPVTINISVPSGGSATDNILLTSINGFAGTVTYTCLTASGITCTLNLGASDSLTSGGSNVSVLTVNAPASSGNGSYYVFLTGRDAEGQFIHSLGLEAIVSGASTSK